MKRTTGIFPDDTRHWADENMVIVMSSFLKTPIVSYKPQRFSDGMRNVWYTIDGVNTFGAMAYSDDLEPFNDTNKQIVLNNLSQHFEPAEL